MIITRGVRGAPRGHKMQENNVLEERRSDQSTRLADSDPYLFSTWASCELGSGFQDNNRMLAVGNKQIDIPS